MSQSTALRLVLALAPALLLTAGCGEGAPEVAVLYQEATGVPEVRLLSANAGYAWKKSGYGHDGGFARGYIEVENLAYHKQVVVHYEVSTQKDWLDVAATYVGPTSNNREVWSFQTPGYHHPPRLGADFRFAVRYSVGGQTYWDNNDGRDYRVGIGARPVYPRVTLGGADLDLIQAEAKAGTFVVDIAVKNLAFHKEVKVVYTFDDWATVKIADASYRTSSFHCLDYTDAQHLEQWQLKAPVDAGTKQIKLAISYTVNGVTSWDNNQGADYTLPVPGIIY
jgi:hypothetical protein